MNDRNSIPEEQSRAEQLLQRWPVRLGLIWGVWTIRADASGGFHIWPLGAEDREEEAVAATEQEVPAELVRPGRSHF